MGVTELPRALSPWASSLALFPREVALALAPLVQRLHALLGEGGGAAGATGEPDGYDGIARRGPYERLLATEWLLHAELPEEFLRRVAAGEHSFLKLARRPPRAGRRAAVLFDAGPDQLGGPRMAHLAALVVLAARLERSKGTLSWGVLQDESVTLETGLTRAKVEALLGARSARPVSKGDVLAWLGAEGTAGLSELWLVGAEDLRPEGARLRTSMLVVAEGLSPAERLLHVSALVSGSRRPAEVTLELPSERACVRILRDPFGTAVSPPAAPAATRARTPAVTPDPAAGLVISGNGRRLYVRGAGGELLIFVVPNSPRAPVPPLAVFNPPDGQSVLAAGTLRERFRTVVVCGGRGAYFSHRMSVSRQVIFETHWHRLGDDARPLVDPARPLAALHASDEGILRFTATPEQDVVLEGETARHEVRVPEEWEDRSTADNFVALQDPTPLWTRAASTGGWETGKIYLGMSSASRTPICLDSDRRRVIRLRRGEVGEALFSTTSPIAATRVINALGLIGFVTEDGQIGVYSISAGAMVLSAALGALSP